MIYGQYVHQQNWHLAHIDISPTLAWAGRLWLWTALEVLEPSAHRLSQVKIGDTDSSLCT